MNWTYQNQDYGIENKDYLFFLLFKEEYNKKGLIEIP
jgi:hypothetical protein